MEGNMPTIAQWFFKAAVVFLLMGILMGLQMSISGNHNVIGVHAHTNLLGWVTSAIFGGYYALKGRRGATALLLVSRPPHAPTSRSIHVRACTAPTTSPS
jgi:hypothetical protein